MCAIKSDFSFSILAARKQFLTLCVLGAMSFGQVKGSSPWPDYSVGETSKTDIASPLRLIVIDHARTEKLRQQEGQAAPAIFRFDPTAIDQAEASLRQAFAATREKFRHTVQENYAKGPLNDLAITYPRFQRLLDSFQRQSNQLPVSAGLARVWALGGSDEPVQTRLIAQLREMMEHPIANDALPEEFRLAQAKLISLRPGESAANLALLEQEGSIIFPTNIYLLARAREEFQDRFPPGERDMGRFVAGFVKATCVFDPELTRQSRAKRIEGIWAADEYQPGQLIVKSGDAIDARVKAVLDQLRERAMGAKPSSEEAEGSSEAQTVLPNVHAPAVPALAKANEAQGEQTAIAQLHDQAIQAQATAQSSTRQNRWLLLGLIGPSLTSVIVLWRLEGWRRSHSLRPAIQKQANAKTARTVLSCPTCTGDIFLPLDLTPLRSSPALLNQLTLPGLNAAPGEANIQYWKERALAAECHAQKTNRVLRTALVPHLARWLRSKVMRKLARQRAHLLETQQKAEQDLAELEQRLASMHAPLEERLKAYEERIAELQKNLHAKGEENREIIKATIAIARKKLETERSQGREALS